jgi:hypothetical protein
MRLNNWSIASYDTARIFAGLGFGSSTASRSIIARPRRTDLCSGGIQAVGAQNHRASSKRGLGGGSRKERGKTMAKTYRDVAIDQMIATVEEAMSRAIDWWGDLPTPMNEAIDKFRVQLGAAIDSVEFVKKALDRRVPETTEKATEQR